MASGLVAQDLEPVLAFFGEQPDGAVRAHDQDLDRFMRDGALDRAVRAGLIQNLGGIYRLSAAGKKALGIEAQPLPWATRIIIATIVSAALLAAAGESLGWWNLIRADDPSVRVPNGPLSRQS